MDDEQAEEVLDFGDGDDVDFYDVENGGGEGYDEQGGESYDGQGGDEAYDVVGEYQGLDGEEDAQEDAYLQDLQGAALQARGEAELRLLLLLLSPPLPAPAACRRRG